jgi:hypothetical protein
LEGWEQTKSVTSPWQSGTECPSAGQELPGASEIGGVGLGR